MRIAVVARANASTKEMMSWIDGYGWEHALVEPTELGVVDLRTFDVIVVSLDMEGVVKKEIVDSIAPQIEAHLLVLVEHPSQLNELNAKDDRLAGIAYNGDARSVLKELVYAQTKMRLRRNGRTQKAAIDKMSETVKGRAV